jgi:hypothetical protein
MKKEEYRRKTTFEKKNSGLSRVRPSHRSTKFGWVVALTGLLTNPDRSNHQVDPPGRSGFNNNGLNTLIL